MSEDPTVVSAKRLMDARHQKQMSGFHKQLMSDIGQKSTVMAQALQKHRDAGTFDGFDPGTRFLGKTGGGDNAPFKVEGHSVSDWDRNRLAQKAFERKGITPTLIEHGGKRWLPMLDTSTGDAKGETGDWSRGRAYLDMVKAAGYPKMGIK